MRRPRDGGRRVALVIASSQRFSAAVATRLFQVAWMSSTASHQPVEAVAGLAGDRHHRHAAHLRQRLFRDRPQLLQPRLRVGDQVPFVEREHQRAPFALRRDRRAADPASRAARSHPSPAPPPRRSGSPSAHRRPKAFRACRRPSPCGGCRRCRRGGIVRPRHVQSTAIESRVMPASGPVSIRSSPIRRLTSVDLPAFGWPMTAICSGFASATAPPRRPPPPRLLAVSVGGMASRIASKMSGMPMPCSAEIGDRIAEAERIGLDDAAVGRPALGLVGEQRDRPAGRAQHHGAKCSSLGVTPARASMTKSTRSASAIAASVCRRMRPGERLRRRPPRGRPCRSAESSSRRSSASASRQSRVTPGVSSHQRQPAARPAG